MKELRVPVGVDSLGNLVRAAQANRRERYFCPSCREKLVFRDGTHRVRHFAHPANGACSQESILHKTAKLLIANVISANAAGAPNGKIVLDRMCDTCRTTSPHDIPLKTFSSVAQEVKVGKFICDVVGYRDNGVQALSVEIFHMHGVSGEKLETLPGLWIELDAAAVIQNPNHWQPIQSKLKAYKCKRCKEPPPKPLVQIPSQQPIEKLVNVVRQAPIKVRNPYLESLREQIRRKLAWERRGRRF
jgi:hypothetical protein